MEMVQKVVYIKIVYIRDLSIKNCLIGEGEGKILEDIKEIEVVLANEIKMR